MTTKILSLMMAALLTFLSAGLASAAPDSTGREQLTRAFDAAFVRILNNGMYRTIIGGSAFPGAPAYSTYTTNISDCLPLPADFTFPDKPKGRFATILATGTIRKGTIVGGAPNVGDTASYFNGASQAMLTAMIGQIGLNYGVTLAVTDVSIPTPFDTTLALITTTETPVDFIDQVNALGGTTEGLARRYSRRSTCTVSASGQYIHVPARLAGVITSMDDLLAHTELKICTGNLSTQLARAYFPNHFVDTRFVNDISSCDARIALPATNPSRRDVYINSLPSLSIATAAGLTLANTYTDVDTHIHAGTPLWVAKEGIDCGTGSYLDAVTDTCVEAGN